MTDSRAALEERAARARDLLLDQLAVSAVYWTSEDEGPYDADSIVMTFRRALTQAYEAGQNAESSSLKLLLSAIFSGRAHFWKHPTRQLDIYGGGAGCTSFPVELDSSGIPVITEEILKALEATK